MGRDRHRHDPVDDALIKALDVVLEEGGQVIRRLQRGDVPVSHQRQLAQAFRRLADQLDSYAGHHERPRDRQPDATPVNGHTTTFTAGDDPPVP